jgi:4-hydroxy-3-methylbut-2-en-1-yl diphosphate reductase
VNRAIDMLVKASAQGPIESLGAIVHNQQVTDRLAGLGVTVVKGPAQIEGKRVAIGAHGVPPDVEKDLRSHYSEVINTTCPFVHRAQRAGQRLIDSGFFVVVYGEANHPEVKGILGWAEGNGIATLDENFALNPLPRRIGVLSQTTQIPSSYTAFLQKFIGSALGKDSEIRIIDTICHDIRERQQAALELAQRVDLMLVVGSHTSANTNHLAALCAGSTQTHLIETAADINPAWLTKAQKIGVSGGASTSEEAVNEVIDRLKSLAAE